MMSRNIIQDLEKRRKDFSVEFNQAISAVKKIDPDRFRSLNEFSFQGNKELSNRFRIFATGRAKVGKSSFLNRFAGELCGKDRLYVSPVASNSMTTCVHRIRHGDSPQMTMLGKDKLIVRQISLDLPLSSRNELILRIGELLRKENEKGEFGFFNNTMIYEIVIELPEEGLRYLEIVDAPGRGERKFLDNLVDEEYKNADLILYISEAFYSNGTPQVDLDNIVGIKGFLAQKFRKSFHDRVVFIANNLDKFLGDLPPETSSSSLDLDDDELSQIDSIINGGLCVTPLRRKTPEEKLVELKDSILRKLEEVFEHPFSDSQVHMCCSVWLEHFKYNTIYNTRFRRLTREVIRRVHFFKFGYYAKNAFLDLFRRLITYFEDLSKVDFDGLKLKSRIDNLENSYYVGTAGLRKNMSDREKNLKERLGNLQSMDVYMRLKESVCRGDIMNDIRSFYFWEKKSRANSIMISRFVNNLTNVLTKAITEEWDVFQKDMTEYHKKFNLGEMIGNLDNSVRPSGKFQLKTTLGAGGTIGLMLGAYGGFVGGAIGGGSLTASGLFASTMLAMGGAMFGMVGGAVGGLVLGGLIVNRLSLTERFDRRWREKAFDDLWGSFNLSETSKNTLEMFTKEMNDKVTSLGINIRQRLNQIIQLKESSYDDKVKKAKTMSKSLLEIEAKICNLEYKYLFRDRITRTNQVLGLGSYGEVKLGRIDGEKDVAIKTIRPRELEPQMEVPEHEKSPEYSYFSILNEIHIMNTVRVQGTKDDHVMSLICFHSSSTTPPYYEIVMERCFGGDLSYSIIHHKDKFTVKTRSKLMIQACKAVRFLHGRSIIYRDLKVSNCLLLSKLEQEENLHLVVADYGISKLEYLSQFTQVGTMYNMDPAVNTGVVQEYGKEVDIYSLGVLFAQIWERKIPVFRIPVFNWMKDQFLQFVESNQKATVLEDLKDREGLNNPGEFTTLQKLVNDCTKLNGKQRPNIHQVLEVLEEVFRVKRSRKTREYQDCEEDPIDEFEKARKMRKLD